MKKAQILTVQSIPSENFVEICFENLESDPLKQIQKIYQQFELPGLEQAIPRLKHYLTSLQGYQKNHYPLELKDINLVESHWMSFIQRWQYRSPQSIN